jgi:hypothetical protein
MMADKDIRLKQLSAKLRNWISRLRAAQDSKNRDMQKTCNKRISQLKRELETEKARLRGLRE